MQQVLSDTSEQHDQLPSEFKSIFKFKQRIYKSLTNFN